MSNRSLIEINHDHARDLNTPAFLDALALYVRSGDKESADRLRRFGARVFGMRHHSDSFEIRWGTHAQLISESESPQR